MWAEEGLGAVLRWLVTTFKGVVGVSNVGGVNQFYFGGGAIYPDSEYIVAYIGGAYLLLPPDIYDTVWDARVNILFYGGGPIDVMSSTSLLLGDPSGSGVFDGRNSPLSTEFINRWTIKRFWSWTGSGSPGIGIPGSGQKIWLQFQDFYSYPSWVIASALPYWSAASYQPTDGGYSDNSAPSPMATYGLWKVN